MNTKDCKAIKNIPGFVDGWVCGECNTYNSDARTECKNCNHTRCGDTPEIKTIPIQKKDGTVMIAKFRMVPETNSKKVN